MQYRQGREWGEIRETPRLKNLRIHSLRIVQVRVSAVIFLHRRHLPHPILALALGEEAAKGTWKGSPTEKAVWR